MNTDYNAIKGYRAKDHVYDGLKTKFFSFFDILLKVMIALSAVVLVVFIWDAIASSNHTTYIFVMIFYVYLLVQYVIELVAYTQKDLTKAKLGLLLLTISIIPAIITIWQIINKYLETRDQKDNGNGLYLIVITYDVVSTVLHLVLIYGAYQLYTILSAVQAPKENSA